MSSRPEIEFLWWEECSSWDRALKMLREEMAGAGFEPDSIRMTEIDTDEDAERTGFAGSPTIRIDGSDFQPPGPDEPRGLTCRIYRLRDGRVSPLPDRGDLRAALEKARDR